MLARKKLKKLYLSIYIVYLDDSNGKMLSAIAKFIVIPFPVRVAFTCLLQC